jgi:hypothetical protein
MTWHGHVAHIATSSDALDMIVYAVLDDDSSQVRFTQRTGLSSPVVLRPELRDSPPLALKFPFIHRTP